MTFGLLALMRISNEDAEDFSAVLVVEPANADAQAEMQKLTILIQQEKAKVSLNNYAS